MLQPSSLCYAVPSLKRRFYEALSGFMFFAQFSDKKMGCKLLFPHLDRIGKSANLFSTNAIICEIMDFMTSFLKNKCS